MCTIKLGIYNSVEIDIDKYEWITRQNNATLITEETVNKCKYSIFFKRLRVSYQFHKYSKKSFKNKQKHIKPT